MPSKLDTLLRLLKEQNIKPVMIFYCPKRNGYVWIGEQVDAQK